MYRFVDLRYQGTGNRFAFFDTVTDRFREYDGEQAWSTFDDLELAFSTEWPKDTGHDYELARMRNLCPKWVFDPPTDEEVLFREDSAKPIPIVITPAKAGPFGAKQYCISTPDGRYWCSIPDGWTFCGVKFPISTETAAEYAEEPNT